MLALTHSRPLVNMEINLYEEQPVFQCWYKQNPNCPNSCQLKKRIKFGWEICFCGPINIFEILKYFSLCTRTKTRTVEKLCEKVWGEREMQQLSGWGITWDTGNLALSFCFQSKLELASPTLEPVIYDFIQAYHRRTFLMNKFLMNALLKLAHSHKKFYFWQNEIFLMKNISLENS